MADEEHEHEGHVFIYRPAGAGEPIPNFMTEEEVREGARLDALDMLKCMRDFAKQRDGTVLAKTAVDDYLLTKHFRDKDLEAWAIDLADAYVKQRQAASA